MYNNSFFKAINGTCFKGNLFQNFAERAGINSNIHREIILLNQTLSFVYQLVFPQQPVKTKTKLL